MAYNITLTNGQNLVTVADGTTDSNYTSLTLIGKNFAGYGSFLNENFIKMLENFSNSSQPPNALQGQLWWDSTNKALKVYNGTLFKTVSSSTSSTVAPTSPVTGDIWWDASNGQLKVWSGSTWVVIGPAYSAQQGQTGVSADTVLDTTNGPAHVIVKFYVNNSVVAILSKDASFTTTALGPTFTTINPGLTLSTTTPNQPLFNGTSTNTLNLGGIPAASYLRSDQQSTSNYPLTVNNNSGITLGALGDFVINVTPAAVNLTGVTYAKDLALFVNHGGGGSSKALSIVGTTGEVQVTAVPTTTYGVSNKGYVDSEITTLKTASLLHDGTNTITGTLSPNINNTVNLGTSNMKFASIYATTFSGNASTANYADLAERFESDAIYAPGTVVELGGIAEITKSGTDLSENVFGVISTRAAYLMNANAGDDSTHPPIAMQGRVPVRVTGVVNKGDRLVSAGNGLARAASKAEITPYNVIGRALQNKTTTGEGTVEAIVKLNS